MPDADYLHEVAITAIVYRDDKFLIIRRSAQKKRFSRMWTVPGGRLQSSDYTALEKDTKDYWYNVLERTLRREVSEEVRLEIEDIEYLTSLATVHKDGSPSLVVSCVAKFKSGEVVLQPEEAEDYAWVTADEAKDYDLIDGIHDELVMAVDHLKGQKKEWQRS